MENHTPNLTPAVREAFATFKSDKLVLALPLRLTQDTLQSLPAVHHKNPECSLQSALNRLDDVLDPRTCLYLFLRRQDSIVAITYVPYLAKEQHRSYFLEHRYELVRHLGEGSFSQSLICKEIGEITDARSWEERDVEATAHQKVSKRGNIGEISKDGCCEENMVKDLGYKRNKCRLCDRRMKNKITPEALKALSTLHSPGSVVQICIDVSTETLTLTLSHSNIPPSSLASLIPTTSPTFTFYHHPDHQLMYFIFHSPDTATVQQRMKHTMAIPGLLVHAEDVGVHVDRKTEIHEPADLVFEQEDDRAGRFRSMFNRKGFEGTEYVYANIEADRTFLDALK